MRRKILLAALLSVGLVSCDKYDIPGMIAGSSPSSNERFAQSKAYNDVHGFEHIFVSGDGYTFYASTDSHVCATANGISRFVSAYMADSKAAPFALFLGDAMDRKNNFHLFLETVKPVSEGGRNLFCTPGNHDLYFGQWTEYIAAMKTGTYLVEVSCVSGETVLCTDLLICLDSASGTLGTEQRDWLESVLSSAQGRYRHIIIFTHTHFFKRDNSQGHTGNFGLEEGYDLSALFSRCGVDMVLSGHDHFYEDTFFKNVRYLTLAAIDDTAPKPCFYTFTVAPDSISVREISL